jgi:mono/diheme cytochrome c family protein
MSAASHSKRGWLVAVLMALVAIAAAGAVAVYAGLYNVAADIPHTEPVYWLLQTTRERSIAVRATDITVPSDLDDTRRIGSGAGQYAEMCASCHLAPGMKRTEIARGLNPRAPELRRKRQSTPAEDFWVVKHGVKMTGMPAWGGTHDDEILWDVVAFLQKLPELSPDQYRSLVRSAPRTHEGMMHEPNAEGAAEDQSHH